MTKGRLISFEGPDGAGKTTVLREVVKRLEQTLAMEIEVTREPGGVAISEAIRDVILNVNHTQMDGKTELLLYIAARRQHLVERVRPALEAGKLVLMDRYIDSSVAYQGYGRQLSVEDIEWLNAYATDHQTPDLTLLFDIPSEVGLERIQKNDSREVNRLDLESLDMHQRVRNGYLDLAQREDRIHIIDANQPLELVIDQAIKEIMQVMNG